MSRQYLSDPSVKLEINGKKVKPKYSLPNPTPQSLPTNWRSTKHPDYQYILWSYIDAPALTCNGLRVVESKPKDAVPLSTKHPIAGSIRIPNISVFDYDGNLPLNLQRTQLAQDIPFEKEIFEDVLKDFLSFVLVYSPHTSIADISTWDFYQHVAYQGIDIATRQLAPWFCTDPGMVLQLLSDVNEKNRQINDLQNQLEWFKRHVFGRRSEKFSPNQLTLFQGMIADQREDEEQGICAR